MTCYKDRFLLLEEKGRYVKVVDGNKILEIP